MTAPKIIRSLTAAFLEKRIREFEASGRGSFLLPDLLGSSWPEECEPFWSMYESQKVAGQEMGRLLRSVCLAMGLTGIKENRFGKSKAITRWFFPGQEKKSA